MELERVREEDIDDGVRSRLMIGCVCVCGGGVVYWLCLTCYKTLCK